MKKVVILFLICFMISGCGEKKQDENKISNSSVITCEQKDELVLDGAVLIDVRTGAEYDSGHLSMAINLAVETIEKTIENQVSDKNAKIVVYCQSGKRSAQAKEKLEKLGYKNVYDLGSINNCQK